MVNNSLLYTDQMSKTTLIPVGFHGLSDLFWKDSANHLAPDRGKTQKIICQLFSHIYK